MFVYILVPFVSPNRKNYLYGVRYDAGVPFGKYAIHHDNGIGDFR